MQYAMSCIRELKAGVGVVVVARCLLLLAAAAPR
jgi:hypothetical protein